MTEPTPAPITDSTAAKSSSPPRGRLVIIGTIVALVIVAAGAGAYAFQKLSGGGTQPSEVLPASVLAYARVDVDPSASQKIALLKLIRKFPEAAKSLGINSPGQDVRKLLLKDAISGCGLTYDEDIKPWIGSRLGVALLKDGKSPIFALQVKNEGKARTGINAVFTKCLSSPKPGIAFLDGYALITERTGTATQARAAAQKASLSENKSFVADTKALGGQGFASAWVTQKAFSAFYSLAGDSGELPPGFDQQVLGKTSTAISLRASHDALELSSVGKTPKDAKSNPAGIGDLPANTALALSAAFGGDAGSFSKVFEQLFARAFDLGQEVADTPTYTDPGQALNDFERQTGLRFPEDLTTLLGDRLTVAVGSDNLETLPALQGPEDVARLNIAIAMHSDADKAIELAVRLKNLAAKANFQLTVTKTTDGAIIATNPEAAAMFDGNGKLGAKESFKRVIPDGPKTTSAVYVDVATIVDALEAANPPEGMSSVFDQLKAVSAVGFSTSTVGDYNRASLRIAFKN
jgi:hypothetical protein